MLKKRYPDLQFLLSFFPSNPVNLPKDATGLERWLDKNSLSEVDVLYISGLVGFPLPSRIFTWLKEKKERVLIFIEDELGAFASFKDIHLLENPQIHFHYAATDPIEELASRFPTDRLRIYEEKPFDTERLQRVSATFSAMYSDVLYSHRIVRNVLTNFRRLSSCFDARGSLKNMPIVICGAGPSLEKSFAPLRKHADRGLILAGGSAITALTKNQIQPHIGMALDPNEEEFDRLRQSIFFEGAFLFAPRLHHNVFSTVNGPFGYLKSDTGGLIENWFESKLGFDWDPIGPDLGREAFSVTTLAVSHAVALGCNPIIFAGVDLSFQKGRRYAKGVQAEASSQSLSVLDRTLIRKGIDGSDVETQLKWVMEADAISEFAQKHPETTFLNATEGGLGFHGIKNCSLDEAFEGTVARDYHGIVHSWIQNNPLFFDDQLFAGLIEKLERSLERCRRLCTQIGEEVKKQKESGKLALYESDFHEEIAYTSLLEGVDRALDQLLVRYYPSLDVEEGKWEQRAAKYQELDRQIGLFQNILQNTVPALNL